MIAKAVNSLRIVFQRFAVGRMTVFDILYRCAAEILDTKPRKRRSVTKSADFLGLSIDDTFRIATMDKQQYYEEWNRRADEASLNDLHQARLYNQFDYYVSMLPYEHRKNSWYYITKALPRNGILLEYGCGSGVLTEWVLKRRPDVTCIVADIPSRTLDFVRWKFGSKVTVVEIQPGGVPKFDVQFDVIACLDVLEHTPNPVDIADLLSRILKPGGKLFIDFIGYSGMTKSYGSNLLSAQEQRTSTINLLNTKLRPIREIPVTISDDYWGVYTRKNLEGC
jgi:2-polyprenyl-3-methyl-5-hydroxy-6-metoxy-1,4-benzoquinol methylase